MQLEDWLDDLCVRFIINLPPEELESVERICFQVEEAQWFYEDFIRPLDPSLPSLTLRAFSLRIFQHCPLFSEWSADSYTAAFAEFLAYKSRVPVRGAIMLNEDMDQVVLVKGWKKGANWSFPRGKINKDEDDLDCAVREVYEETGFDIRAAGLVQDAKDMKYIEITMREQHMRLYVFRGVPMDTYFEPRTRKEISKIEWYKLNDLPTLKKNKQQEGMGESLANANKFYMVAPFLVPLKKWISQQRKRGSRVASQNNGTIPIVTEELFTDYELDITNGVENSTNIPSDLPEVSQPRPSSMGPPEHLQHLVNANKSIRSDQEPLSTHVDTAKSNALLALLRKGSRPDIPDVSKPNTPFDQISFPPDVPRSPHHRHPRPPQFSTLPPPPQFPISPIRATFDAAIHAAPYDRAQNMLSNSSAFVPGIHASAPTKAREQASAPYQRTGDPDFSHPHSVNAQGPRVPPASALPSLTSHAKSLLDVFKSAESLPKPSPLYPLSPTHKPLHSTAPPTGGQYSHTAVPAPASIDPSSLLPTLLANRAKVQYPEGKNPEYVAVEHRANLLGLFMQLPSPAAEMAPTSSTPQFPLGPVELAASSTPDVPREELSQMPPLRNMLQPKYPTPIKTASQGNNGSRESRTSATISGPLNQPQFEGITKRSHQSSLTNGPAKSPAPAKKTLFDPNQGVQKKILARPASSEDSPARTSRPSKPSHARSPKRPTSRKDDNAKLFQPQILRRPAADQRESSPQATVQPTSQHNLDQPLLSQSKASTETHKQTLLSLFSTTTSPPPARVPSPPHSALLNRTSTSPTASGSAISIVSPLTEKPLGPTRSRLGSLASIVSTGSPARPAVAEKRQTAAGDRAFLLGYLGRIAGQEG